MPNLVYNSLLVIGVKVYEKKYFALSRKYLPTETPKLGKNAWILMFFQVPENLSYGRSCFVV